VNRHHIVLAFSGDSRSCAAVRWLTQSCHADVAALIVDVGQLDDPVELRARAISCGAVRAHVLDRCDAFARDVILPAAAAPLPPDAGALRRLAHAVIAAALVEVAAIEAAGAVAYASAHPSMGEHIRALDPAITVVVIPPDGLVSGAGAFRAGGHLLMRTPLFSASEPAQVTIGFDENLPVSVNEVTMGLRELIEILSLIGGEYASATAAAPALDLLRAAYSASGGRGAITLQLRPEHPVLVSR
jgi:argininosuccinate synthase